MKVQVFKEKKRERDSPCTKKEMEREMVHERSLNTIHIKLKCSHTLMITCFGGLAAEKLLGIMGTCFTSLSSRRTRLKTSPFEISSSEYHDGSAVP